MVRVNEFELHGVISTESKLSESEFFEKFFKMLEDNEMSFGGSFYMMDDNGNYTSDLTFCDLFFYIQSAERDSVGMHRPEGMSPYALHIYSDKHQVNMCKGDDPIADFVFSDNIDEVLKVKLVRVDENMYADYDNHVEIEANECIDQDDEWYVEKFGSKGTIIRETLKGILSPVHAKQLQQTQTNLDEANEILGRR